MRKLKLFFAACALCVGAVVANAANLPTSGSGEFFLKNVGTGNYLKGDAYYGTKVVTWNDPYAVTLTYVSEGVYTIKTQQNNGGENQYVTSGADPYVDGVTANMTFTEVDAVNHYFTINNGDGNLYAKEVTEDGATLYIVNAGDVSTDYAKWQVISREELVAALGAASSSNPIDATFFIKDAGIDVKSVNASSWTTTNVNLGGGANAGHNAESWSSANFSISQTVTGLPNGKYRATCHGYYRWNSGSGGNNNDAAIEAHAAGTEVLNAIFFAGSQETPLMSVAGDAAATAFCLTMPQEGDGNWKNGPNNQWQAAACFTKGYYLNTINDVIVTDGTLEIGVRKTTQAGTDWAVFDEFKLYYLGEDISIYETPLAEAKTAASGVNQEAIMNASVLSALQSAISTYGSKEFASYSTVEEITTAISALNTAANNANTSISNYEKALSILNAASSLDEAGQASYTANETVAAIQSAYTARTLESVSSAQQTTCAAALRTAAKAQTTAGANMTLAIENWDFLNCSNGNFPGWTISAPDGGNTWVHGATCVEFWNGNHAAQFDYYQTVSALPAGVYTLSASMWNTQGTPNESCGVYGTNNEVTVFAGVDVDCDDSHLRTYTTDQILVLDGDLRLGVKSTGDRGTNWFGVDWIKLTFVRAATADDYKPSLASAISAASSARQAANEGTGVFQIPVAAGETLASAIATAQGVYDDGDATVSEVQTATTNVSNATNTYKNTTLNAPDADKRYWVTIVEDGKTWNGNAITFIAGARTTETLGGEMGGYGIKYLAQANANLNQALKFTAVDGETNTYKVSAINVADGGERYITTGSTYEGGNNSQIRTTDDATQASWIKIKATATNGQFQLLNVSDGNKVIANNNNDDMYTANSANFTIAEAEQATVSIKIASNTQLATRIFPFTPTLPTGVKAYSCSAVDGENLTLTEVEDPAANTPYILYAENGCTVDALTGWGIGGATDTEYTVGLLTGVYEKKDAPVGSWVLQKQDGVVSFYKVGTTTQPKVGAYHAYLTYEAPSTTSRLFFSFEGEQTAIDAIKALTSGKFEIYNVSGAKLPALQKGMNILKTSDGRSHKVMVK